MIIKLKKPQKVINITDEKLIDKKFIKIKETKTVDKAAIKKLLSAGEEIEGAELVDGKESLIITDIDPE